MDTTPKNPRDNNDDNDNSDCDDGFDGVDLVAAAEEGLVADVLPFLLKNLGIIQTVRNTVLYMATRLGKIGIVCNLISFVKGRQTADLKTVFMDVNVDGDKYMPQKMAYHLIKGEKRTRNVGIYSQPEHLSGPTDVEMRAVQADLTGANRSVTVCWMELYHAINKGNVDVIITGLVRDGKKILRRQDSRGETLLHASVKASGRSQLWKLVRFLISNRMTDAARLADDNGDTALHLAVKTGELNAPHCLIKAEPKTVYQVNHKGVSPLYMAVMGGCQDIVKCMVHYCCLRDFASEILLHPKHATLAHLAIKVRSFGILKILMEHLPELVKATDKKGWRPLSYAANNGALDEVTYILTNFPKSAEKYDKDGTLPIHKAVGGGHVSIIKAFFNHCPQSLYHVDQKGRSVLHIAVIYARDDILTYLTKKVKMDESFLNLKDNMSKTFMDYAKDLKH